MPPLASQTPVPSEGPASVPNEGPVSHDHISRCIPFGRRDVVQKFQNQTPSRKVQPKFPPEAPASVPAGGPGSAAAGDTARRSAAFGMNDPSTATMVPV